MKELTSRERLLRCIKGQETDRVAWSPFLAYYWEHLPESVKSKGQLPYLQNIGADPLLRGFIQAFDISFKGTEVKTTENGKKKYTSYETKVGTITEGYTYSESAHSWFLTDHPVKEEEDFKVLQYMMEHAVIEEKIKEVNEKCKELGEQGVYLPTIGTYKKTAFQSMVEHWCGTVDLTYALFDFPEVVEECLAVIQAKDLETVSVSAKSNADGFIFWEDSSTTNISPQFFEKYTMPEINAWGKLIHENNKLLIHHACGLIKDLIAMMGTTNIDMIESISPPPTGNIEIKDAFPQLPSHVGLIGGIEPTFIEGCSLEQLHEYVNSMLTISKGRRYVLANSDSCPPGVAYEKFTAITKWVREFKY